MLGRLLLVFKGLALCLEWSLVNKTGVSEIDEVYKKLLKCALFAVFFIKGVFCTISCMTPSKADEEGKRMCVTGLAMVRNSSYECSDPSCFLLPSCILRPEGCSISVYPFFRVLQ